MGRLCSDRPLFDGRVLLGADLQRSDPGYVAIRSPAPVDLVSGKPHPWQQYFAPLTAGNDGYLFLERDRFYILVTRERIQVPADLAVKWCLMMRRQGSFAPIMLAFLTRGWGLGVNGRRAVLEVRPHEDDLILRHGQPICAMVYERLQAPCEELYGSAGNHYAEQDGPRLSKFLDRSDLTTSFTSPNVPFPRHTALALNRLSAAKACLHAALPDEKNAMSASKTVVRPLLSFLVKL